MTLIYVATLLYPSVNTPEISRKIKKASCQTGLKIRDILQVVRTLCRVDALTTTVHDQGLGLSERYGFSIDDSMILASALLGNCRALLTEGLQDGQVIEKVLRIQNPFKPA